MADVKNVSIRVDPDSCPTFRVAPVRRDLTIQDAISTLMRVCVEMDEGAEPRVVEQRISELLE